MKRFIWLLGLLGLSAIAQSEVETVRSRLARARQALSSPQLTDDERRMLESKVSAAEKAFEQYVSVVRRGDKRAAATAPLFVAGGTLLADDVTGVGAADDALLPIVGLALVIAHATTAPPATDSEIGKAWLALIVAMEAASTTARELARQKKPGCYCYCLETGTSRIPQERVDNPDQCRNFCEKRWPGRFIGHQCGGDYVWW
jgi:hypothetical protein